MPLFPLDLVLFPGVALPLHIFEPRYRLMVKRCMESRTPFGVININGGEIASIGTIADIREATRYVDGRWDLVTLGTSRFHVIRLDRDAPYLRAEVKILDEPAGGSREELMAVAERVSAGFVDYLELLRGEGVHDHGDEEDDDEADGERDDDEDFSDEVTAEAIDEALAEEEGGHLSEEVVSEIEKLLLTSSAVSDSLRDQGEGVEFEDSDNEDGEATDETDDLLATAITRLSGAEDPVSLSHIVGGVVQLSNAQRQSLLEAPDARTRLVALEGHLERERLLLAEGIRPWSADPRALRERRN
ncbi:MAG: LON peptidase substrate-binding domain-containing protein [Candidatus Limnocylindrus sp.]